MGTVQAKAFDFPDSFYARHIYPIFDANCVVCHGAQKVKGGLRMDTYDRLMRGGKEGAVIIPGKPERSILLERITLPPDHKKFMPSEGKPPLKPEEIAWIRAWIQQGASQEVKSLAGIDVPEPFREEPVPQVGDYSKMMGEISQTAKSAGVTLVPVSKNLGDGLILNTVDAGPKFGDAQLAGLVRFAPYIVEAELGRTSVTDGSFATLGKFSHLRALHLEGTAVTGAGLANLTQLPQLTLSQPEWDPGDAGRDCSTHLDEEPSSSLSLQHAGSAGIGREAKHHEPSEFCAITGVAALGTLLGPQHTRIQNRRSVPWTHHSFRLAMANGPIMWFLTGDNCRREKCLAAPTAGSPPTRPEFSMSARRVRPECWCMTATASC